MLQLIVSSSRRFLAVAAFLFSSILSAAGAEMEVFPLTDEVVILSLKGEITDGDGDRFVKLAEGHKRVLVALESPGGLVREALQIGAEIRMRDFGTTVFPEKECFSACGLIWVSGARRYISPSSQIGFHAAYKEENGEYRESGVANAEIGSFLTHLGLRIEAIRFFTIAGPNDFLLLNPERARALGIEIYEQNGAQMIAPADAPTADIYADRFVSYSTMRARCRAVFQIDEKELMRSTKAAMESGVRLVGNEKWIDLWLPMLDQAKRQLAEKGAIALCLETEKHLRLQKQATGIKGPSFACAKASSATEKAMCADPSIWAKDRAMQAVYSFIRGGVDKATQQKLAGVQREWIAARNECASDRACLHEIYDLRLAQFQDLEIE